MVYVLPCCESNWISSCTAKTEDPEESQLAHRLMWRANHLPSPAKILYRGEFLS